MAPSKNTKRRAASPKRASSPKRAASPKRKGVMSLFKKKSSPKKKQNNNNNNERNHPFPEMLAHLNKMYPSKKRY
jgi:hypothetical protein